MSALVLTALEVYLARSTRATVGEGQRTRASRLDSTVTRRVARRQPEDRASSIRQQGVDIEADGLHRGIRAGEHGPA